MTTDLLTNGNDEIASSIYKGGAKYKWCRELKKTKCYSSIRHHEHQDEIKDDGDKGKIKSESEDNESDPNQGGIPTKILGYATAYAGNHLF
jgi:hypothetical protein